MIRVKIFEKMRRRRKRRSVFSSSIEVIFNERGKEEEMGKNSLEEKSKG